MEFKSQAGQDQWVCRMLGNKTNGYFIDIGAHDGISLSNTYTLEKEFEWTGICVEPAVNPFSSLFRNRECICTNIALWDSDCVINFLEYQGDSFAGHIAGEGSYYVCAMTFGKLLKEFKVPTEIDYISLDIEGGELEVIKTFPFDSYNVKLWTIEHSSFNDQGKAREKIQRFMSRHGYKMTLAERRGHDEGFYYK